MKLYIFPSTNTTNIWAGIGARLWAVSQGQPSTMKTRVTKASAIRIGQFGLLYDVSTHSLTTPFLFTSRPDPDGRISDVWETEWVLPFSIFPLGTPRKRWIADQAVLELPFNRQDRKYNLASVFHIAPTQAFSPIEIGEDDWQMIVERLAEI